MYRHTFRHLAAAVFLSMALAAGAAEDYEIKLHRPVKAGQRFKQTVKGKDSKEMKMESGGKALQSQRSEYEVDFEGETTVLEVSSIGRAVKQSLKVTSLTKKSEGKKTQILAPGTVIKAFLKDGRREYEIEGVDITPDLKSVLDMAADLPEEDSPTDDEVLGTTERKKVGDRWPINQKLAEKVIGKDGTLKPKNLRGDNSLKEVLKSETGEILLMDSTVKADVTLMFSPTVSSKEGPLTIRYRQRLPADVAQPRIEESMEIALTAKVDQSGPNGQTATLTVTSKRSVTRTQTLLK